jgi:hypothetical protein
MKAATLLKAGEAAIKIADNERPERYKLESWDPAATFGAGIRRGGSLSDNELNLDPIMEGPVPFRLSEECASGSTCSRKTAESLVDALTMLRLRALDHIGGSSKRSSLPDDHPIKVAAKALRQASLEGLKR